MKCQELLSYLQEHPGADLSSRVENAEISSHLALCAECSRMVKQQGELVDILRVVRKSECDVPVALDSAVLANYRRQISELQKPCGRSVWAFRPVAVFAWTAAAAALVFAVILFLSPRREVTRIATPPTALATESSVQVAEKPAPEISKGDTAQPKNVAVRNKHNSRSAPVAVRLSASRFLPQEAFRSLMYCDELSCSDAMEMIRVELPASYVTRPMLASMPANGVVTADVLVGPDGIARGIRIEE